MAKYKIEITDNQAALIILALVNESVGDAAEFGEYSYARCYHDMAKKLIKAGYLSEGLLLEFNENGEYKVHRGIKRKENNE